MNDRLSLKEISDRIALNVVLPGSTHYGTSFDRDYVDKIQQPGSAMPQVWVVAQRFTATDDGSKYSGLIRQSGKVEVVVRGLFQRYADGQLSGEQAANDIHTAVRQQLLGWMPTGANRPLVWGSEKDGQATESFPTLDMIFVTEVDYQGE